MTTIPQPPAYEYDRDRLSMVPAPLRDGLDRYITAGIPPGYALACVLRNAPIMDTIPHLDAESVAGVRDLVLFLHNYAPGLCHGSPERVEAWQRMGGLNGGRV